MISKRHALGTGLLAAALLISYFFVPRFSDRPQLPAEKINALVVATSPRYPLNPINTPLPKQELSSATERLANPLELSPNLRAIYDQFKNSNDALERHIAYRAWSACFPTFIAPQGQPISIESLTKAMPASDPNTNDRVDAYRTLQARCTEFFDMTREETLNETRHQQEASYKGQSLSPGDLAVKQLMDGNKEAALSIVQTIFASGDPFAISSLQEFVNRYLVAQVDAQSQHSAERPDLRSLAYTIAACQMGLECGSSSLTALQLCTSLGECSGSVSDRYLRALPSQSDRNALKAETRRVVDAIQTGQFGALGL